MRGFKRKYTNGEITVFWDPALCIHAMNCIDGLPEVFRPGLSPWIDMKASTTDKICEAVETCPTAAIRWRWNKDLKAGADAEEPKIEEGKLEREED
jgi:uncharacterized Fe-S cluster protein YjdI